MPNSYHTSQYETATKTDARGTTEQTCVTETRRVTQSTMRLEHKSPYPDIEPSSFTPKSYTPSQAPNYDRSPAPFVSPDKAGHQQFEQKKITSVSSSNSYHNSGLDYPTAIPEPAKYSKFDHSKTPQAVFYNLNKTSDNDNFTYHQREEFKKLNLIPGPQPEFGVMPKADDTKKECISDRIKKLESSYKDIGEAPQGGVKILPFGTSHSTTQTQHHSYSSSLVKQINDVPTLSKPSAFNGFTTPSPKPTADGLAMQKLWSSPKPFETSTDDDEGELKRHSIKETAKAFDTKISEYKNSAHDYELKAPGLVRTIFPAAPRPRPKSFHEYSNANVNLLPGPAPEMCYAPRVAYERGSSLVETIEQSLVKDMEKPPTRVIPGAVRMMPPSPLHSVPDSTPTNKLWTPKPTSGYAADTEESNYRSTSRSETIESHTNRQFYDKVGTTEMFCVCVFLYCLIFLILFLSCEMSCHCCFFFFLYWILTLNFQCLDTYVAEICDVIFVMPRLPHKVAHAYL